MKVKYFGLGDDGCLDVGELTSATQRELIEDLTKIGKDVQAVLTKGKYRSVKRVK